MASGLVCRANRPNTWLHRPACKREEKPCQLGAVHTWHEADLPRHLPIVRFRDEADMDDRPASTSAVAIDPKRTKAPRKSRSAIGLPQCYLPLRSTGKNAVETARVHHAARRRGGRVAARGARAAAGTPGDRLPRHHI